ncbi:MAG: FAD-dependent oxidoreductase, partial [Pseudomonadota bacterium]
MFDAHRPKIVLVGHGMVGQKFLEQLHAVSPDTFDVTVLCEEPRPAYDRVHLSSYFTGTTAQQLSLTPDDFFASSGYALNLGEGAASIDTAAKTLVTTQGRTLSYDALVLATGSYPFVPPLPGKDRAHCLVYR